MSYSVLLVDDEELVYDVMIKKMNWEEMGFHIEGYAHNGIEALEMAEEMLPDVVMTDIKMPYMDGLTLSKRLKKLYPNVKIIIFSGFDEFEYAKEAIKIEAEEYILKPIDSGELADVFARVKKALDKEIDEKRNIDMLQQYYLNSLPVLQDNFYISLLEGRLKEENIAKYASDYQISFSGPYFVITVFRVGYTEKNGTEVEVPPFLLVLSVERLVEEQLANKFKSKTFSYLGDVVVVSELKEKSDIHKYTDMMDTLCKMCKRICDATVTAGVGYLEDGPEALKDSYKGAKHALAHRVLYGSMRAINVEDIESRSDTANQQVEEHLVHNILKYIRVGEKEALGDNIHDFCASVTIPGISIQDYHVRLMKLTVRLLELMGNYSLDMNAIVGNETDLLTNLYNKASAEALESYLNEVCVKTMDIVSHKRQDSTTSFVTKAEEYVKEHYSDQDMSIDTICGILNVSSAYFSTAFKKSTGKTFINYLTDYRMEQAVRLLETGDKKAYEISDQIGYSDPNYFSYVFKKKFGVSPSKYRDSK